MTELQYYQQALIDFTKPIYDKPRTNVGFCIYFYDISPIKINIENDEIADSDIHKFSHHFPVLFSLRPKPYNFYWFKADNREDRIKLLEKAIQICKSQSNG
jgi:hypothetical protein